jgi:HD-GYP domain-containing protein (c-di-GMP phosphodiesterase class II)
MQENLHQFQVMDTQISKQKDTFLQILFTLMLAIAIACLLIVPVSNYLINDNYKSSINNVYQNMKTRALSKFNILELQTASFFDYSNFITNSDTIKILLTDYSSNSEDLDLFNAQKPYIDRTLQEFVEYNADIVSAKLISNDDTISQYSSYTFIKPENLEFTTAGNRAISSLILEKNKVFVDVIVNINGMDGSVDNKYIGNLAYRLDITNKILKILEHNEYSLKGSNISIIGYDKQLKLINGDFILSEIEPSQEFQATENLTLTKDLNSNKFMFTPNNQNFGYQVRYDYKVSQALNSHNRFKTNTYIYASLLTIVISLFVLAMFWKAKNNKTRHLANQYSTFAKEINKKQTMLEGINTTIDEHISLKDLKGQYLYANNAFTRFFNITFNNKKTKDSDFIKSTNIVDIFTKADEEVSKNATPWNQDQIEITNENGTRYFDITKWPQKDGTDVTGIITIARDRTEPILHQKAMEKLQNQSIQALVKTVEIKDPHLAGHHARMAHIADLIAKKLELSKDESLTLNYSAKLAGIGKVFVPQALLTKPGKLTEDELAIIQTHILSAKAILSTLDFTLPIAQTIENMYERLDGSGYPEAKKGEQITKLSRILAISDAFCALIVPRSYRDAIEFNDAIEILEKQVGKYDADIIAVLKSIITNMPKMSQEFIMYLK